MNKNQPKLKVQYKPLWRYIDIACIVSIIASIVYLILNFSDLPDQIPIHFNAKGEADSFGSKSTIWIIPFMSVFQYGLLTIISRYPHTFNYTVKITDKNAAKQYNVAIGMMSNLKLSIVIFFSYTSYQIVQIAKAGQGGLGMASTALLLIVISLIIINSIIQSKSNK